MCPVPWAMDTVIADTSGNDSVDNVNSPSHYTNDGGIECIEGIEAQLTPEEYKGYLRGNCAKYLWRWRDKGGIEDLRKCKWYLDRLIFSVDQD